MFRHACIVSTALFAVAGCAAPPGGAPAAPATVAGAPAPMPAEAAPPVKVRVTDLDAFAAFVGTHPTPADFAAAYPGLTLVLPGEMATKELRTDNSRYFAELDAGGRITGGRFQ